MPKRCKGIYYLIFLLFLYINGTNASNQIEFPGSDSIWVDSVFKTLSLDEQIAQMIFIRANKDNMFLPEIPSLISDYNVGGIVFFKSTPVRMAHKTNEYQALAKTPLMICMDAERGLAMRLDSTTGFPYAMTLGAAGNEDLTFRMADIIGRDCKRMGIHMNFAPVVDINSNPSNPVINVRSFGQDREKVLRLSRAYIKGHTKNNTLCTAKHFPGHGDTDTDSHLTLPLVNHSKRILDSIDLYPYWQLINEGLDGIMIAHLYVPELERSKNIPSTLSRSIVTGYLQETMKFNGLIVTDALEMGAVTNGYKPGEIEVKALIAGNDILLMPQDVPQAIQAICDACDTNYFLQDEIARHCKKILRYKYKSGLHKYRPVETAGLIAELNSTEHRQIAEEIVQKSVTLIKNTDSLLPIGPVDTLRVATLVIGSENAHPFQKYLRHYVQCANYSLIQVPEEAQTDSFINCLSSYNLIIAAITNTSILSTRNYGISTKTASFVHKLASQKPLILNLFGNPYALNRMPELNNPKAILITYQDNPITWKTAAEIVFGARPVSGETPVSISEEYPFASGICNNDNGRLIWTDPLLENLSAPILSRIDSLIQNGINKRAYPGCQVLFAHKGKVIYHKAFGTKIYDCADSIGLSDLYDIASLTKIFATTLAIMKLVDDQLVNLDEPLSKYLPELRNSNKSNLIIRDVMCHQAGLKSWIPFYRKIISNNQPDTLICKKYPFDKSIQVADSFFIPSSYRDTLLKVIIETPLEKSRKYLYSDLGFILLKELIERVSEKPFQDYLSENFYNPLGLKSTGFNPLKNHHKSSIIPTENDTVFRKQLINGYVHDPAAAMFGGISGHAGLFSDAEDLAVIFQMLLNKGTYGGKRYLKEKTINTFTSVQFPWFDNRRGIGFDKPLLVFNENGPSCKSASAESFGHSGFTGTYCWADPVNQSLYIFLSNRIYPDASNNKLSKMNIRTDVHELFYQLTRSPINKELNSSD